ncbi:MAG: hypothetical protein A2068_11590 [Ignavibacteria bacterium GWB2_35_6b]|nr:MAG: hypothetical protein A2068_11590 [Ignavibacteria bacterium GWB2_35_6b]
MFNKLVTPIATQITTPQNINVDSGYFLEKLLLFDKIIVESIRFNEIPKFVRLFGFDSVMNLIKDESISFTTEIMGLGNFSNNELSSKFLYDFNY